MEGFSQGELWCLEALQIGATGQDACFQGAGESPICWDLHPSPCSLSSENIVVLAEKVSTLGFPG